MVSRFSQSRKRIKSCVTRRIILCTEQLSESCSGCHNSERTSNTQSRSCQDLCQIPRNQTSTPSSIFSSTSTRQEISSSSWTLRFQPRILKDSFLLRLSATQIQIGQAVKVKTIYQWVTHHHVLCQRSINKQDTSFSVSL